MRSGLLLVLATVGVTGQQHPGILNVTAPPYSIDNTGSVDVTLKLQAAINAAYEAQLALFLPCGRYLVSDTLEAAQDNYGHCSLTGDCGTQGT